MKYLGKGDSPESIVTKQRLEETISERIAAIPKAGVDTPGLLSSEDYLKLAGIEPSANFYTHPTAHPISFITGLQAALDAKAPAAHSHTIANITNLQTTLDGKANSSHTHSVGNITGLQATLDGKANAAHTHDMDSVVGLEAALDDKADVSYVDTIAAELDEKADASHTHLMGDVEGLETALSNKASASHVYAIAAELNDKANASHTHSIGNVTGLQTALDGKVDDSQVLTNVPLNAKFTDTITTINSKTGAITKADIVALGIPAQDTVVDISGKADKTYVDNKVKTDVPVGAKFTDTVYSHPASHPASMITGLPTSLPANGGNADTVGGFTVGVNVPANAKFTDTNTTYSEISTAEIDAGTASAGRTITGRRVKYILDKISGMISAAIGALTKSSVGLGNVDNTSDASKPISTATQAALDGKVNNSQVLTNVPSGAKFTDTLTTINGKTGAISKADIVALGIPAQDTVVDISGKADKTYVDSKVKTDVPVGAKFTDTVYTHPTTAGNKHIPTGGASGQVLKYSASGTATWQADNDTITTINGKTGAISKADITALGIPAQDTVYTHPTTHSISEVSGLQTALDGKASTSHSHTIGNVTGLQAALNGKANASHGHATTEIGGLVTALSEKASISHAHNIGNITNLRTELDGKAAASHVHTIGNITGLQAALDSKVGVLPNATEATAGIVKVMGETGETLPYFVMSAGLTQSSLTNLRNQLIAALPTKVSELTNDSGFLTSVTKSDVGLSNVDNVKQMPISGGVLENYREKLVVLSGGTAFTTINLSLGNVFRHSLTVNTTYSITNAVNGQAHSFTLIIEQAAAVKALTLPAGVKWQGGEIPDMTTASKTYVLTFMTVNGGTTWLGMFGGEF